jgi:hypothetical protein
VKKKIDIWMLSPTAAKIIEATEGDSRRTSLEEWDGYRIDFFIKIGLYWL